MVAIFGSMNFKWLMPSFNKTLLSLANILVFLVISAASLMEYSFGVVGGCLIGAVLNVFSLARSRFTASNDIDHSSIGIERTISSEKNKVLEDLDREVARRREAKQFNRN